MWDLLVKRNPVLGHFFPLEVAENHEVEAKLGENIDDIVARENGAKRLAHQFRFQTNTSHRRLPSVHHIWEISESHLHATKRRLAA